MVIHAFRITLFILLSTIVLYGQNDKQVPNTQEMDELLRSFFDLGPLGGVALVSVKGKEVYKKAFGRSTLGTDRMLTPSHRFRIASNTKQFTACAILKLAETGKLSLGDDITDYIKDYPTGGHLITIEHLLTHTSGIADFTSAENFPEIEATDYEPEAFIAIFKEYPKLDIPGAAYHYSNSGYFLLGRIIEKVTGKRYGAYLKDTFFKPLGMDDTYIDYPTRNATIATRGFVQQGPDTFAPSKKISMSIPFAAGALVSTVEDIHCWYKALKNGKVVGSSYLKKAHTPFRLNDGSYTRYGYGWDIGTVVGTKIIAHGGAISGFYSTLVYAPAEDVLAVVLTNCNWADPSFFDLATRLTAMALDKTYFKKEGKLIDYTAYEAVYSGTSGKMTVSIEGGLPFLIVDGGRKRRIHRRAKDLFYCESNFTTMRFGRDSNNEIYSLEAQRSLQLDFKRTEEALPKKSIYSEVVRRVMEDTPKGLSYYQNLKTNSPDAYNFENENELNRLGYDLLATGRAADAILVFKTLIAEFPASYNPYDSLAEAYYTNNELQLAKEYYQRSLALNPGNENAKTMLSRITKRLKNR